MIIIITIMNVNQKCKEMCSCVPGYQSIHLDFVLIIFYLDLKLSDD